MNLLYLIDHWSKKRMRTGKTDIQQVFRISLLLFNTLLVLFALQRKRQEEQSRHSNKRSKQQQQQHSQWLQQLNQSDEPLRHEERKMSVEVEALVRSCFSAFSITDKNFLGLAKNAISQDGKI